MTNDRSRRAPTAADREAHKIFKAVTTKETMTEYAKAQKALYDNRERLKTERLAREAEAANRTKAN
ncbi:hypothetical protein HAP48_0038565 [Bradyrhizobium septentrionale]|uniref:Uncharacterized protein n=1 Tax=Bradyrhizobium septentrionale TaxID=1404411 RepID=A0A973W1C1_9BRAD|nr:hypothetical protein [Bradyrhizobium septentrionale]UGY14403.1 hypothetical protein HAP48_0038565 [Bradyrhizobium septentrionale]UGY22877.1 hypothetical protein HU675_0033615 [Bradyrhizobium septentrionale]